MALFLLRKLQISASAFPRTGFGATFLSGAMAVSALLVFFQVFFPGIQSLTCVSGGCSHITQEVLITL